MANPIYQTNTNEEWNGRTGRLIRSEQVQVDVTEEVVEYTLHGNLDTAMDNLRTIANGTTTLTTAQLTTAVRLMAKVILGLVRLVIRRLDDIS